MERKRLFVAARGMAIDTRSTDSKYKTWCGPRSQPKEENWEFDVTRQMSEVTWLMKRARHPFLRSSGNLTASNWPKAITKWVMAGALKTAQAANKNNRREIYRAHH